MSASIEPVGHDHMLFDTGQSALDTRVFVAITFVPYRFHAAIWVFDAIYEVKCNFLIACALFMALIIHVPVFIGRGGQDYFSELFAVQLQRVARAVGGFRVACDTDLIC
ncbi:hypothetical protein HB13667_23065 [Pseudomonas putida]|uniref:Uncharacterized protein n=1 Tax=Pseudomonas putida TaxID=303 RepID=A0A0P7C2Q7_PSEPU|nr:hypothetical protein HB13667_23065 [Pseudomonas putida]KXK71657.1 hypothetical protein BC89_06415 [Pseudomonas monteilii]